MAKEEKNSTELKKASEAIFYELSMLNACATTFNECEKNRILFSQFTINILIESFCVHLRNMIEFFGNRNKDRITYQYFISQRAKITFPHNIKNEYNEKVNNLLSHLTFNRLSYELEIKSWNLGQIANDVNENFKVFSENVNNDLFCVKLKDLTKNLPAQNSKFVNTTSDAIINVAYLSTSRGPTTFKRPFTQ
jgi:hypothetical protein